jgi:hypothetical protein
MSTAPARNRGTPEFWERYRRLPPHIRQRARSAYRAFLANPNHPALRRHPLEDSSKGRHRTGTSSVSINMQYRALYIVEGQVNVWYWIGSHNDYDNLIGGK